MLHEFHPVPDMEILIFYEKKNKLHVFKIIKNVSPSLALVYLHKKPR